MPPQQKQGGARRRPSQSTGPLRRKSCYFCKEKIEEVDYKNYNQLRRYVSEKGKIRSRRITGACRRHQEQIAVAVKRALPFKAHGALDAMMAPLIPALPWLLGFARDRRARNFFLALAAVTVVVTALTDWDSSRSEWESDQAYA